MTNHEVIEDPDAARPTRPMGRPVDLDGAVDSPSVRRTRHSGKAETYVAQATKQRPPGRIPAGDGRADHRAVPRHVPRAVFDAGARPRPAWRHPGHPHRARRSRAARSPRTSSTRRSTSSATASTALASAARDQHPGQQPHRRVGAGQGSRRRSSKTVGQTALLRFRQVLAVRQLQPGSPRRRPRRPLSTTRHRKRQARRASAQGLTQRSPTKTSKKSSGRRADARRCSRKPTPSATPTARPRRSPSADSDRDRAGAPAPRRRPAPRHRAAASRRPNSAVATDARRSGLRS